MSLRHALLLALLLVPAATADHFFSHRVYVVGRVIDSEGAPAPGLAVRIAFDGMQVGGACFDSKPEVTSPTGDYEICRHVHGIPENASARVAVGNASTSVAVDPELRHASASLQLDEPRRLRDIHGERAFESSFLVTGRLFTLLPAPENAEGVHVNASPRAPNATVQLLDGAEVLAETLAPADEHGRYRAQLEVGTLPDAALVRVSAGREASEELADPLFRRADVNVVHDQRLSKGPGADAPGSTTPAGAWLAAAALAAGALAWRGRRSR